MIAEQTRPVARVHALLRPVVYLVAALAIGVCLMLAWPQGGVCATSCNARLEAGAQTVTGLAAAGLAGLVAALWLGLRRRGSAPRWLLVAVAAALLGAFAIVAVAAAPGGAGPDETGLAAAHAARAWIVALPALALLLAESAAALGEGRRRRAAALAVAAVGAICGLLVAAR